LYTAVVFESVEIVTNASETFKDKQENNENHTIWIGSSHLDRGKTLGVSQQA